MTDILDGVIAGPESVDRRCYIDPAIYELEQKRVFEKAWLFVAHASELGHAGDFRTTELAGQPVIAIRGVDDRIRVFFNSCRHKGTTVVGEREGTCRKLKCPYHHWTYDTCGKLISVPRVEGYGKTFQLSQHGLVQVPRVANFKGLIFANLDPDAPSFEDYLGPAIPYLA